MVHIIMNALVPSSYISSPFASQQDNYGKRICSNTCSKVCLTLQHTRRNEKETPVTWRIPFGNEEEIRSLFEHEKEPANESDLRCIRL